MRFVIMTRGVFRFFALLLAMAPLCAAQDVAPVIHVDNPPNLLAQQGKHYVVLVSLDGFRYDYAKKWGAPHLDEVAKDGASTPEGMRPSYPSITFPNHLTLVTGLRPEHHGIVAMDFADPFRGGEEYRFSDSKTNSDGTWYQGTPIWVLAEQQGMRAACFFWPGSEAAIQRVRPTFYLHFDDKFDDKKRVEQVADWLKLPEAERPHLITLYYANVDHAGHEFGPDATETRDAVHHVDEMIGALRERIKASGLPVDLIVTADHGMIKTDQVPVVLDQFADLSKFKTAGVQLYAPTEAAAEKAYEEFRAHPSPKFEAYRRLDVPKSLHYNVSPREGDPVIVPKGPYPIYVHAPSRKPNVGSHGFDPNKIPEMKAIFYAEGPDIKAGVKLETFDNIDVYPFVAKLLGLETPPVDGEVAPLEPALK
jgi:predicted AlkP superfamily pyrophosphatase or phosphodiesterase